MLEIAASEYLASHQESIESMPFNTLPGYDRDALTLPQTEKEKRIPKPHAMANPISKSPNEKPQNCQSGKEITRKDPFGFYFAPL